MSEYIASSQLWSTCNEGFPPEDGDIITVDTAGNALLLMDQDSAVGETFTVIVPASAQFSLEGWSFSGTVTIQDGGTYIDLDGDLSGSLLGDTGSVLVIMTGTVDGSVDMGGVTAAWATSTGSIIVSDASTLDLGVASLGGPADASGVSVELDANTTVATDITCYGMVQSAGTVTFTDTPEVTVGNGGFDLDTASGLHYVALAEATSTVVFNTGTDCDKITVPAGSDFTASASIYAHKLSGGGTINIRGQQLTFYVYLALCENAFSTWTGLITTTTGYVRLYCASTNYDPGGDLRITTSGTGFLRVFGNGNYTLPFTGDIDVPELQVYSTSAGTVVTFNSAAGKRLTVAGDILLGDPAGSTGGGVFSVDGQLIVEGDIKKAHANNLNSALNLGPHQLRLGGTFDGDGIAITVAVGNRIVGGTLTNVDAELTETIRAYRSVGEADASNVNVKFRKRLGSASSGLMNWQSLGGK